MKNGRTKLTLSLSIHDVEFIKAQAAHEGRSVSRWIALGLQLPSTSTEVQVGTSVVGDRSLFSSTPTLRTPAEQDAADEAFAAKWDSHLRTADTRTPEQRAEDAEFFAKSSE
jgi:hypothetical protein